MYMARVHVCVCGCARERFTVKVWMCLYMYALLSCAAIPQVLCNVTYRRPASGDD